MSPLKKIDRVAQKLRLIKNGVDEYRLLYNKDVVLLEPKAELENGKEDIEPDF